MRFSTRGLSAVRARASAQNWRYVSAGEMSFVYLSNLEAMSLFTTPTAASSGAFHSVTFLWVPGASSLDDVAAVAFSHRKWKTTIWG